MENKGEGRSKEVWGERGKEGRDKGGEK